MAAQSAAFLEKCQPVFRGKQMSDPYAALVRYYDAENADLKADLSAYSVLVERFGGPVLDIGCGTGRVAFHLAQRGLHVTGIDTSAAMLDRARQKAARQGIDSPRFQLLQADVRTLALDERFGLAIFAYNGFMHLLRQSEQIAALERIVAHLKPDGGLAIDLPNPVEMFRADDVPGLVLERTFTDPETGQTVMQQSLANVDRAAQVMTLTWVYDRIGPDGAVQRDVIPLGLRYTMALEMKLLLGQVGLRLFELYGDYDFCVYKEDSPRLFVVAARAENDS